MRIGRSRSCFPQCLFKEEYLGPEQTACFLGAFQFTFSAWEDNVSSRRHVLIWSHPGEGREAVRELIAAERREILAAPPGIA